LNKVRKRELVFVTSQVLLNELRQILVRTDKPFNVSDEAANRILHSITDLAEIVQPASSVTTCRHEQDNRVLECAIDGKADWIISGDRHLLELQSFQKVTIGTVADFLSHFD
jgi:putative PIN family toxin of toxin-antitoxin system